MLSIRLIGTPSLERDGAALRQPRGRKAWALLGYLLLAPRPPSRRHVAELLFADAEDPLGALRWTLAELRRVLGEGVELGGDPITTRLGGPGGEEVTIDVNELTSERVDSELLLTATGEFLETVQLPSNLEFESWLLVERYRLSAALEARLRQHAVALLARGEAAEAVRYASLVVARNSLDEGNHELLVRSLAAAGDRGAAQRQVEVCADLLRRELGIEVSAALREAAVPQHLGPENISPSTPPLGGQAAVVSQLEAGRAAIVAGAVDAGLECLRRAVAEAGRLYDSALRARALTALGSALIHAARGRDEEGSLVLQEAIGFAAVAGDRGTAVTAHRELGFVEVQAGRRDTGDAWLTKAQAIAVTDAELAAILGVRGMNASDRGDYPHAFELLGESVDRAAADDRQRAWSLSLVARAHLLRGDYPLATEAITESMRLVREQRWMAFQPWPQSIQAELAVHAGDVDGAADALEHAWVLACQLGDPCWEGVSARGLAIVHALRGDPRAAADWFAEAANRSMRTSDRYQWVHAYVLDALVTYLLHTDEHERARPPVATLASLAARCDMREFVVRAYLHAHRLGDRAALAAARLHGAEIDNPALGDLL